MSFHGGIWRKEGMYQSWSEPTMHQGEDIKSAIVIVCDKFQITKNHQAMLRIACVGHIFLEE
jgi:hypothetical protein